MAKETGPLQFFREVKQESARVTWPAWKETKVTTAVVLFVVFLVALFLFLSDWVISLVIQWILGIGA